MIKDKVKITLKLLQYREYKLLTWLELMAVVNDVYDKLAERQESKQYMKAYYDGWKIDYKFDKTVGKQRKKKLNSILESKKPYSRRINENLLRNK